MAEKNPAPSLEERLAKLEQAEASLREREKALEAREESLANAKDSGAVRPVRPSEAVCVGEGYEFEVKPTKADSTLPTKTISCCDESEAIRWYVATTPSPENAGKQVDPVKHPLKATCLDARRESQRKQTLMLANLRAKAERGNMLTAQEQAMLDEADMKRAGF
jgi:hypothetical protein